jgi:type IV secretion system protein VirB6
MPLTNYQNIFASIDNHLIAFAAEKSRAVVVMLEPLVATGGGLFWMIRGFRHITGTVEEPFMEFFQNFLKFGFILSTAFVAGNYNDLIISTFQNSPVALAAALSDVPLNGGNATLSGSMGLVLDGITEKIQAIAASFWQAAGPLDLHMDIMGLVVWTLGMLLTAIVGGLIVLSKVATALMLALGPLYISFLLFDSTKNWFVSWIGALTQYGLIAALAVGANALILTMFSDAANDIAARGGAAEIADLIALVSTGGIGFIVLRQVPNLASTLAGGLALSSLGAGSAAAKRASSAGGNAWNKATNKEGRDNQRAAERQVDVARRVDVLKERKMPRPERANNQISRDKAA